MNSKVEKWLTTGALVGWMASMGSLMVLAVQVTVPRALLPTFAPPANAENGVQAPVRSLPQGSAVPSQVRPQPLATSKSVWQNSLKQVSPERSR